MLTKIIQAVVSIGVSLCLVNCGAVATVGVGAAAGAGAMYAYDKDHPENTAEQQGHEAQGQH